MASLDKLEKSVAALAEVINRMPSEEAVLSARKALEYALVKLTERVDGEVWCSKIAVSVPAIRRALIALGGGR